MNPAKEYKNEATTSISYLLSCDDYGLWNLKHNTIKSIIILHHN